MIPTRPAPQEMERDLETLNTGLLENLVKVTSFGVHTVVSPSTLRKRLSLTRKETARFIRRFRSPSPVEPEPFMTQPLLRVVSSVGLTTL